MVVNKLHSVNQSWEIGSPLTGGAGRIKLYSDSSSHFGGMQSFCSNKEEYIWYKKYSGIVLVPPYIYIIIFKRMLFIF